jgi:UDP-3-O-[3-hydroxymyristoyl] glucosamine N-acyltransferase
MERFGLTAPLVWASLYADVRSPAGQQTVGGLARFGHTAAGDLCFCDRDPGAQFDSVMPGSIVLCPDGLNVDLRARFPGVVCVPVPDPRSMFIDLCSRLLREGVVGVTDAVPRPFGIHPEARIGSQAVIHAESRIDEGVAIGAHCVVHRGTWIQAGAVIRDHTVIGVEGINAHRGLDRRPRAFPHLAGTIIGERVEIGAGVVVARGVLTSTRIGAGSVIGNLSNVGHGVEIGKDVWMSVGSLVGGHTVIGTGATLGMGVTIRDNVQIGEAAQLGMGSVIVRSVKPYASVFGNPARAVPSVKAGPAR